MSNLNKKLDALSKQLNITKRHFERKFKKEVGLLPKQFSSIVRIEKSRSMIRSLKFKSLTDVGLECDYFDQAHFIREFKTFVEETPKQCSRTFAPLHSVKAADCKRYALKLRRIQC